MGCYSGDFKRRRWDGKIARGVTACGSNPGDLSLISWMNILEGDNQLLQVPLTSTYMSIYRRANMLNTKAKDFPIVVVEVRSIKQRTENILNDPKSHFINFENV